MKVYYFPNWRYLFFTKLIDDDDVDNDKEGEVDNEESIAAIRIDTRESIWLLICEK